VVITEREEWREGGTDEGEWWVVAYREGGDASG